MINLPRTPNAVACAAMLVVAALWAAGPRSVVPKVVLMPRPSLSPPPLIALVAVGRGPAGGPRGSGTRKRPHRRLREPLAEPGAAAAALWTMSTPVSGAALAATTAAPRTAALSDLGLPLPGRSSSRGCVRRLPALPAAASAAPAVAARASAMRTCPSGARIATCTARRRGLVLPSA